MEHHNPRRYSGEEKLGKFVFCLSIDMIGSTKTGLNHTTQEQDSFNIQLVKQIRPHLEKLGLTKSLVKFTGDGWLVITDELDEVPVVCCLATIMAHRFREEISEGTGRSTDKIPSLRLSIHSGRDISVELPDGRKDWVGDSVRRAVRACYICNPNEILISGPVRQIALREFHIELVINIEERRNKFVKCPVCGAEVKNWEEDVEPLFTLGDLKPGVAEYSETPEYFLYMLKEIGKEEEAERLRQQASEHLENKTSKLDPSAIKDRKEILQIWNRMARISDYPSVLETVKYIQTAGLALDIFIYNTLINKAPDYNEARVWMEKMKEENVQPDVVTYSTLIKKAPDYEEAKALVDTMQEEGVLPNIVTYNTLVDKALDYNEATIWVYKMRKKGILPDIVTYNTLIKKAPDYEEAKALVDRMEEEGVPPDIVTYNTLVDKARDYNEATVWVYKMREEGILLDIVTHNTLIKKAPDYDKAKALVDTMRRDGIPPNVFTYTALIVKAPDYNEAKALADTMRRDGIPPNVFTYTALIVKAPDYNEAKALVDRMEEEGVPPNIVTYSTLVNKALDYNEATVWVYKMREEGILPDIVTHNTLIKKAPDYEEAKALADTMRRDGIPPNVFTYTALIVKAPDYNEAKALAETMRRDGIPPNVFTYSTLFSKDLSGVLAEDILKWYLAQKYHPPQPIEAAIASYRKGHCLDQALRLALGYPHLPAARKLIREHEVEALSYFKTILDRDPQHPNVDYALGVTLMELGREPEAIPHLKKARKLATADARIKDVEERLRRIDRKLSNKR